MFDVRECYWGIKQRRRERSQGAGLLARARRALFSRWFFFLYYFCESLFTTCGSALRHSNTSFLETHRKCFHFLYYRGSNPYCQIKRSHSIHMLSIQIDSKSIELVIHHQFDNFKLSLVASHTKRRFPRLIDAVRLLEKSKKQQFRKKSLKSRF